MKEKDLKFSAFPEYLMKIEFKKNRGEVDKSLHQIQGVRRVGILNITIEKKMVNKGKCIHLDPLK